MARILVLGGSASGKSAYAESLLPAVAEYVATAWSDPSDDEWTARIAAHRERRPATWKTTETLDLASVLSEDGPPVLIDSITTWVAGTDDLADGIDAWAMTGRHVIAVSDEVGLGVVPSYAEGRAFRDALGRVNQALAATADEVWFVAAGIPLKLK